MVVSFIYAHWVEWVFTIICGFFAWGYRNVSVRLKKEQKKNEAIADGVQALLREAIVDNFNKYNDRGYCPIYAKESIKKVYTAYSALGGNDVATSLYHKILNMKEDDDAVNG